jgi:hypothetical protein
MPCAERQWLHVFSHVWKIDPNTNKRVTSHTHTHTHTYYHIYTYTYMYIYIHTHWDRTCFQKWDC